MDAEEVAAKCALFNSTLAQLRQSATVHGDISDEDAVHVAQKVALSDVPQAQRLLNNLVRLGLLRQLPSKMRKVARIGDVTPIDLEFLALPVTPWQAWWQLRVGLKSDMALRIVEWARTTLQPGDLWQYRLHRAVIAELDVHELCIPTRISGNPFTAFLELAQPVAFVPVLAGGQEPDQIMRVPLDVCYVLAMRSWLRLSMSGSRRKREEQQ